MPETKSIFNILSNYVFYQYIETNCTHFLPHELDKTFLSHSVINIHRSLGIILNPTSQLFFRCNVLLPQFVQDSYHARFDNNESK